MKIRSKSGDVKRHSRAGCDGEYDLLEGILTGAIEDYRNCKDGSRDKRQAELWFLSTDSSYIFSFESVCSYLNLSSNAVRKKLDIPKQ